MNNREKLEAYIADLGRGIELLTTMVDSLGTQQRAIDDLMRGTLNAQRRARLLLENATAMLETLGEDDAADWWKSGGEPDAS